MLNPKQKTPLSILQKGKMHYANATALKKSTANLKMTVNSNSD